jgi:chromosomal replication initiator protein
LTRSDHQALAALGHAIAQRIGEKRYQIWFDGKTRISCEEGLLRVGVPNRFYQEWLGKTFAETVRAAAEEVLGESLSVHFVIDPELYQAMRAAQQEGRPAPELAAEVRRPRSEPPRRARRWHRLEDFVVGPCNRLAHAAARSLVESPGAHANPLTLHGPVGTGKTHLLEGIRTGLAEGNTDGDIRCVSAEEFTNQFLGAMKANQMGSFRKLFREADALLIDDLHFLANKRVTQEEFINTFDALQAAGKLVVVTCDCHPRLAEELLPELIDRLLGGPVWGIEPPDALTRLDILRAKASRGGPVPEEVLRFLAEQLRGNVRELEGALHTVRHFSQVTGRRMDVPLAREAVAELLRHALRVVSISDIEQALCDVLRLDRRALQASERAWAVSHPRMVAMYLARKHTGASYSAIGQYFGRRNHSTVVAAEKKVRAWLAEDAEMRLAERRLRVRDVIERVERLLQR